jgi:hypothetical protein
MNARPKDALRKIIDAHDLVISPLREDRETYGMPSPQLTHNGMKEGYS